LTYYPILSKDGDTSYNETSRKGFLLITTASDIAESLGYDDLDTFFQAMHAMESDILKGWDD
jgi:hypothetical protein